MTIEHLHALHCGLDLQNTFNVAVFVVACVAFWCCRWYEACMHLSCICFLIFFPCSLGELVIPSPGTFDLAKHVSKHAPIVYHTLPSGVLYTSFHILWSKTAHAVGADVIATAVDNPTSAISALCHHATLNVSVPPHAPLFSYASLDMFSN